MRAPAPHECGKGAKVASVPGQYGDVSPIHRGTGDLCRLPEQAVSETKGWDRAGLEQLMEAVRERRLGGVVDSERDAVV